MTLVSTAAFLIASKLQDNRLIDMDCLIALLPADDQDRVCTSSLADAELRMLVELRFDVDLPGPMVAIERYLRLLDLKFCQDSLLPDICYEICKYAQLDQQFLEFQPSKLAACAVIIGYNIY